MRYFLLTVLQAGTASEQALNTHLCVRCTAFTDEVGKTRHWVNMTARAPICSLLHGTRNTRV